MKSIHVSLAQKAFWVLLVIERYSMPIKGMPQRNLQLTRHYINSLTSLPSFLHPQADIREQLPGMAWWVENNKSNTKVLIKKWEECKQQPCRALGSLSKGKRKQLPQKQKEREAQETWRKGFLRDMKGRAFSVPWHVWGTAWLCLTSQQDLRCYFSSW